MPDLPTGTVTFLFTDIEGSTKLWEQYPEAMKMALARHDAILRNAIERHNGHVFKTVGDAFCAVFSSMQEAIDAALAGQRALQSQKWGDVKTLRVRMALHAGTEEERDGDYFGPTLNRVARLLAIGHGEQVLLSSAIEEAVRECLPEGVSLNDLGSHRLKDLQQPEHVYQVVHPELPGDFPPLRSLQAYANNLPMQLTSFVGRDREMSEVKRLLEMSRLVMLTGSGGCGKTRLALQVAAEVMEEYGDGIWLVELAALSDPGLVPKAVATTLGVREEPGHPILHTLLDYLMPKTLLLVLDNCEHLLDACASLAETLLRACPNLRILASSREGLGIAGETPYRVPSLSLPDPQHLPLIEELTQYEAVRLFADRVLSVSPAFGITPTNAAVVAQVCHRLDGIPLAIELAAARVKVLSVEQIARRLDDRFRLLTGGSRTALPRQQTLRALIDWSYDLLTEPERQLLRRLAVFKGGCFLEAAESVCSGDGMDARDILDYLASLVDKSLVITDEKHGEVRYHLLETIRQYSQDRLMESGDGERVRTCHLGFYLQLAEETEPQLLGAEQARWLERLEADHDNLRGALQYALDGYPDSALKMAGALWRFWLVRCHLTEGRQWLENALRRYTGASAFARAKVLGGAGILAAEQGDYASASTFLTELLSIHRESGNQQRIAYALNNLGKVLYYQGDYGQARSLLEESLAIKRELGDQRGIAQSLGNLGLIARSQGDYARIRALHEEALMISRESGDRQSIAWSLSNLGSVAQKEGARAKALSLYKESLIIYGELGDKVSVAACLENVAELSDAPEQRVWAVRLFGAAEALREASRAPQISSERPDYEGHVAAVRTALGEEAFGTAWSEGKAMSLADAIEYALETARP